MMKERAWGEDKIGEKWEGGEREGGGSGEKRKRLQSIPNILPNSVNQKFDIRNSTFMHNPTSETLQDQNTYGRV